MTTLYQRKIAQITQPKTLHSDTIRTGRAVMMPGEWAKHDPFLALMNDKFKKGAFGPHPHRGFETVTYVIDGTLAHQDSKGGSGTLSAGDVQWMTAGSGVVHNEIPASDEVHVLQLWLNLPKQHKLTDFRYQDLRADAVPTVQQDGVQVKVFAGDFAGVQGAADSFSPVTFLEVTMAAGSEFRHHFAADENAFVYLLNGEVLAGDERTKAAADDTLWLETVTDHASQITLRATQDSKFILLSGQPLREPIAAYGPFVMNHEHELFEAMQAYRRGDFGEISE